MTSKTEIAKNLAPFKSDIFNALKGARDEYINFFEVSVTKYIEDRRQKFLLTNTFLHQTEKINFYDYYFPLSLEGFNQTLDTDNLFDELFRKSNTAGIIGVAGSGKTMLMKHVFLIAYKKTAKIPIYIELRDLNINKQTLSEYIYKTILDNKLKPNSRILSRALKSGKFLFILDGFDEVNFDIKPKLIQELEEFIDVNHENYFLLSSRPGATLESFPRLKQYKVLPLNEVEIDSFIDIQLKNLDDTELISKLKNTIKKDENKSYAQYLSIPLLLSMYIMTFKNYPEIPKSKNKFYWNVFDTLCTKHDSVTKKGGFIHEKKSGLQNEDLENILKSFSYITLFENHFTFDSQYLHEKLKFIRDRLELKFNIDYVIYDLVVTISIITEEGTSYKFPHRTMQDYFAASFIKDLNPDAKKSVYSEKIKKNLRQPSSNLSFFDLCKELDKEAFYEHFLIPTIEDINSTFNVGTINSKIINVFRTLEIEYNYRIIGDKYYKTSTVRRVVYLYDAIELFKKDTYITISPNDTNSIDKNSAIARFIKESETDLDEKNNLITNELSDKQILEFTSHFGIAKKLSALFTFLKKTELDLKKDLATTKENKTLIWDF